MARKLWFKLKPISGRDASTTRLTRQGRLDAFERRVARSTNAPASRSHLELYYAAGILHGICDEQPEPAAYALVSAADDYLAAAKHATVAAEAVDHLNTARMLLREAAELLR